LELQKHNLALLERKFLRLETEDLEK